MRRGAGPVAGWGGGGTSVLDGWEALDADTLQPKAPFTGVNIPGDLNVAGQTTLADSVIATGDIYAGAAFDIGFTGRSKLKSGSDGVLSMLNSAETGFTTLSFGSDLHVTRSAAATLQLGAADAAAPVAQTLRAQGSRAGTDTNVAGAALTIQPGTGTGNSSPNPIAFAIPVVVASGTGAQTVAAKFEMGYRHLSTGSLCIVSDWRISWDNSTSFNADDLSIGRAGVGILGIYGSAGLTGVLQTGDGTLTNPAYAFGSATATGFLYSTGTYNHIGVDVGGTEWVDFRGSHDGPILIRSISGYGWTSANSMPGTVDTLLCRYDAGRVTANGATVGSAGDFVANTSVLTAGTMTSAATNKALVRQTVSKFTWTNAMVTALGATTTGDISVCTLPAKTHVVWALLVVDTAAAGPTTLTGSIGRVGATYNDWILASDLKAAANTMYGDVLAERGTGLDDACGDTPSYTGTTVVNMHCISTGGNLNTVTTSTGTVILCTETLP